MPALKPSQSIHSGLEAIRLFWIHLRCQPPRAMVLTAVFFLFIFTPAIIMFIMPPVEISNAEKRALAKFSITDTTPKGITNYPTQIEAYVNDHFGCRVALIFFHNFIFVRLFGQSPLEKIIIGRDGWLFSNEDQMLEDYRGLDPPTPLQLAAIRIHLKNKRDLLKRKGIEYLYVVSPNKMSVYPDYLPEGVLRVREASRFDAIMAYLNRFPDLPILDLRPLLRQARAQNQVYYRTDTHWNNRGAFLAYSAIMDNLQQKIPNLPRIGLDDIRISNREATGLDEAEMLGLQTLYSDTIVEYQLKSPHFVNMDDFTHRNLPADLKPGQYMEKGNPRMHYKAVVFRDSFFEPIIPWLSEKFAQVVYIWAPFNDSIMLPLIDQIQPDVVIEETAERFIGGFYYPLVCYNLIGMEMLRLQRTDQAIAIFSEALKLAPLNAETHNNLGYALMQKRLLDAAVQKFNDALQLDPNHALAKQNLLRAKQTIQKTDTAIAETLAALRAAPDDARLHERIANLYTRRGYGDKAAQAYRTAVSLAPRDADILNGMALFLTGQAAYDEAASFFQRALTVAPEKTDIYYNMACLNARRNQTSAAFEWLRQAVDKGYAKWDLISQDSDLEAVRSLPEFEDWMKRNRT